MSARAEAERGRGPSTREHEGIGEDTRAQQLFPKAAGKGRDERTAYAKPETAPTEPEIPLL